MHAFKFSENIKGHYGNDSFICYLPSHIKSKNELLLRLSENLRLPNYFGFNWDALSECLRDFHWIDEKTIVIVHSDLPALEYNDLEKYLEVLMEAKKDWKNGDEHTLEIIFPANFENEIKRVLKFR